MISPRVALYLAFLTVACGSGAPVDTTALAKSCDAGDPKACERLVIALQEKCYRKDGEACMSLAGLYLSGRGAPVDKVKAVAAWDRGCEAGHAKSCNAAAQAYVRREPDKSRAYYEKGCNAGSGTGCTQAASFYREQEDAASKAKVEELMTRGRESHRKACEAADPEGCFGMGATLRSDNETDAHPFFQEAMRLWQQRCDGGDMYACYRVGIAYGEETGVAFDAERSRSLLDLSCRKGHADACAELAQVYKSSDAKDDDPRAAALFEQACLAGAEERLPCREGGFMYAEGEGVPADKAKAARLLDRGCNFGDDWCCFKLGTMLAEGDGVTRDLAKASDLTRGAEGLEFRIVEVKRGKKMVDPGLLAFGIPPSSLTPMTADPGTELIVVSMEARRTADTARLPVRKMFLVDGDGKRYENHTPGDSPFGEKPLERREFLFKVPASARPVKLRFELGSITLALPKA
jgi:TPR repeat protein